MIKFWKSAAKGKSGCPVRPPEQSSLNNSDKKVVLLDTELENYNNDLFNIFEKKSKLSLNLHDILIQKEVIKYFIQFMDSIGKYLLIKCWLELDDFKALISNRSKNDEMEEVHSKISRTQSFDFPFNSNKSHEDCRPHRFSWREVIVSKQNKNDISTSSCGNLANPMKNSLDNLNDTSKDKHFGSFTEEAINLFKKYVALEAPYPLELPDNVRKSVITNICQPEGQISEDCFKPVQDILLNQMENHFADFQNSSFYVKAQIDILTSSSLKLQDILHNETILFYFTEYLEQESCSNFLEFLMAVMHFRDNLFNSNSINAEQAQADAIVLYDKYFSLQAINPLGFPKDIRLRIESDICRDGGPLPTCFDLPYKIIYNTLSFYVKTFLESDLYYKYLSEMIHSVDQMWSSNHKSHSDCSSEYSISTQNTLLAMGDPAFRRKKRNHSVPDMTIDSNQLYNADALWQRKRHDGLSLGRVNSLGRFESKFEPDPDKKRKSTLKKMVSRFVPTDSSKVEEEMAWQIAHMIVKDVTDLTMAPPDNERDDV